MAYEWPERCPADLYRDLAALDSYRDRASPASYWTALRGWLVAHGVQPPEHDLPREPERSGPPRFV